MRQFSFSKKFNSYQRHYSTVEKEALALIWALQHFSVYLNSSAPIVIYTDHNPLTFFNSLQQESPSSVLEGRCPCRF